MSKEQGSPEVLGLQVSGLEPGFAQAGPCGNRRFGRTFQPADIPAFHGTSIAFPTAKTSNC